MAASLQIFRRPSGRVIIINPAGPRWTVTDEVGLLAAEALRAGMSDSVATELLRSRLPGDKAKNLVRSLRDSGIFNSFAPPEQHWQTLTIVHVALTEKCNLKCRYCYARERRPTVGEHKNSGAGKRASAFGGSRLSASQFKQLISDIHSFSPSASFTLTGGEPTLNPDWKEIAHHIAGLGADCSILTNGTLLKEEDIPALKECMSLVGLSADGPDQATHAATRGDNLDAVERAADMLEKAGVNWRVSMTVCQSNIHKVEDMARKWGSRLTFAPLFSITPEKHGQLAISGAEYYRALKSAAGVEPLSYCRETLANALRVPQTKCAIADGEVSVAANGDVYPCQLLHAQQFLAGNAIETPFAEIYNNSASLNRLRRLHVDQIEGCRDCALRYICSGACRARNFYETGATETAGRFCEYEREAFLDGIESLWNVNGI